MRLGILVATDRHLDQVLGIAGAALRRGDAVALFATGDGVRLLVDRRFADLGGRAGVTMSFCAQSARQLGGPPAGLPAAIVEGSQFENAAMTAASDKVIVL